MLRRPSMIGGTCTWEQLKRLSTDRGGFLDTVPTSWTADEISNMLCGRPDWPVLASMQACLWKEVSDKITDAETILQRALRDDIVKRGIAEFRARHGMSPHPYTLIRACEKLMESTSEPKTSEPSIVE